MGVGEPLFGRDGDLIRVEGFLSGGEQLGRTLMLLGEPGVGKSALLEAVGRRAVTAGKRVLRVAGTQLDARSEYGVLRQLLRPAVDCPTAADAASALIGRLVRGTPTLLIVDDAQWLDEASAAVIGLVARRLAGSGVGMLCAIRPGMEGFLDQEGLPAHDLAPLSDVAAEALLARRFRLAPRVRRRVLAEAQGNPLALLELSAGLSDAQRRAVEPLPERLPLSRKLMEAFASEVTALPAATRHLLLIAALANGGDLRVLSRAVAGRCDIKHLAPAEHALLIEIDEASGRLRFRHRLTRSAVAQLSSSDQRRSAHRALADALAAEPELQAWHLGKAATGPDERVALLLDRAAVAAGRRGEGPKAVAAMALAADLSPDQGARARRLSEAACLSAVFGGDLHDVSRLLADARNAAPDAESPAAAVADSACLMTGSGELDSAHKLLTDAVARVPEPYDPTDATLTQALYKQLMVAFLGGRAELWTAFDDALGRYTVAPSLLSLTRSTFADAARATAEDLALLDGEVADLVRENDPVRVVRVAMAAIFTDRLAGCVPALERVALAARAGENIALAIDALFLLGIHALHTGQWQRLRQVAFEGLELCEEYRYPMLTWPGRFLLAYVAAARGDVFTSRGLTDQIEQWACPRRAEGVRAYSLHARALCALTQGNYETAYRYASLVSPPGSFPRYRPQALWLVMDLVDSAVRTGRREEARAHAAAAHAAGLARLSPRMNMLVLAATAIASDDDRHPGLAQALAVEGAERWPFDLARIRLYHGERLRRAKSAAQARDHLLVAAQAFTRLGAERWAERARQELRACGGRGLGPGRAGAVSLTPQQWEIARLAAGGLSNKQIGEKLFLSPRTVSSHLYKLFPKLGVSSRAALRDALEQIAAEV